MIKISENFTRHEFACQCGCGFDTVDVRLIEIVQAVRDHFQKPVVINSASRCHEHNKRVGGSDKSQHLLGRAADIVVGGVTPSEVADFINVTYPVCGLGRYSTFTHVDSRNSIARWAF